MRRNACFIAIALFAITVSSGAFAQTESSTAPRTVREWFDRENLFLRRYLRVVQQATHDYAYGYKTPTLLMPVAMDLFTGYAAYIHEAEERLIYPALLLHMTPEQQHALRLVVTDQQEESGTVIGWQHDLVQYEAGKKKLTEVADTIDYLARMINRHFVLQEERVLPMVDSLTPKEQASLLKNLERLERDRVGVGGRSRYERLLGFIEGEIKAVATRIW